MPKKTRDQSNDDFYSGFLAALAVVYVHDDATSTLVMDMLHGIDEDALLAIAKQDDLYVEQVSKSVAYYKKYHNVT